jgi:OFA family oxalate/formate antiporter-like MFS transporter
VIIFGSSVISIIFGMSFMTMLPIVILLCVINAGYGGGFSTLPTLLQSKFGMEKISTIHGFALSAWAWAGLSGNQLSNLIINRMNLSYEYLFVVLLALYITSFVVTLNLKKSLH